MAAAAAVVGGPLIERPIIVVKNQMLALKANDVRDAGKISIVFCDYEGRRVKGQHHTCRIDKATLIIISAGVLLGRQGNIRRVLSLAVFGSIGARDKDGVIAESHAIAIAMTLRNLEKIRKSLIDCIQNFGSGHPSREDVHAAWCRDDQRKNVAGNLLSTGH